MSDRGTGLLSVFEKVFVGWPHLFCYKHLVANLIDKYKGRGNAAAREGIRHRFFECAYSSSEKEFMFHLAQLRDESGGHIINQFLSEMPLENWCRAFFKGDRYGIMANSATDSFNNWMGIEREIPVFDILDTIRLRLMNHMSSRRDATDHWSTSVSMSSSSDFALCFACVFRSSLGFIGSSSSSSSSCSYYSFFLCLLLVPLFLNSYSAALLVSSSSTFVLIGWTYLFLSLSV